MIWRTLGFASLLVILGAGVWPLTGGPLASGQSVSQSWARQPRWLAVVLTVAGAGACAGIAGWIIPHYGLALWLYAVVALAFVGMVLVAWVPLADSPGNHGWGHWHFVGGAGLATLAVVALAAIAVGPGNTPEGLRLMCGAGAGIAASWPLLYLSTLRRYFLLAEISIAGSFCACVIALYLVG